MVTSIKAEELRKMSDQKLAEFMAGWKESTGNHALCRMEFQRRHNSGNEIRGWLSLGISSTALVVSIIALATKYCA